MRIGLLIYGSLDTLSGGYLYDRKLVEHLRQAGDVVEIISLPWRNYPRRLLDNLPWQDRLKALAMDVLLQDELNHPSLFLANRRLRQRVSYPIISIVHHLRASEDHPDRVMPFYRRVERAYLATLDGFVFNSQTTRGAVNALLGRPAPGIVAYPAADHLAVPPQSAVAAAIERRRSSRDPLRVLFVGNVIPRKGLHHLLDGLARLPRQSWHLDVVGSLAVDPGYAAAIRRQLGEQGLAGWVKLWDRLPDAALAQRYQAADLLAVPSYEGFGIVYLEAMAWGLPVLASTAGAAHEIVTSGENGYLLDPRDAAGIATVLGQLQADRDRLARLGQAARRRFDVHPAWADSAARIRSYLEEIIARGRDA